MANSNGHAEVLVEHLPTITHLQCVENPDKSHKFQFLDTVVVNGRSYGRFVPHPELYDYVKRYDRKLKDNKKRLRTQQRQSSPYSPNPASA